MENSYFQRLEQKGFELNDTDDLIAEYISQNRKTLPKISIQAMGAQLYVAPNSIMRFAKKLGYSGFSELKYAVAQELKSETEPAGKTVTAQLLSVLPVSIARTMDVLDPGMIARVAALIDRSDKCLLAGVGDSLRACEVLRNNLRCYNDRVVYNQHIHDMEFSVCHAGEKDVLLIVSARGQNERLVALCQTAKARGIATVSLTHCVENPLAALADYTLYFYAEHEELNGSDITDRSGQMILLRLLSERYWKLKTDGK